MATISAAFGTSHSPQVSAPYETWPSLADRDRQRDKLLGRDNAWHTFGELEAAGDFSTLADPANWAEHHRRAQAAIETLHQEFIKAEPDVVIIVGDDQREFFGEDGRPTLAIYWGSKVDDLPRSEAAEARLSEAQKAAAWSVHADRPETYRVDARLAEHLITSMMVEEFDVTQICEQPAGRGVGHAFTFVRRRLMEHQPIPIVPVMVNTYFPPNQPSPRRCIEFGRALRRAVEAWDPSLTVAFAASGGLSHVTIDEPLDHRVLDAIANGDLESLFTIPRQCFQAGTSEILNWLVVAGAAEHLTMEVVDYIPAYRSPAGTGVGMGFALWCDSRSAGGGAGHGH